MRWAAGGGVGHVNPTPISLYILGYSAQTQSAKPVSGVRARSPGDLCVETPRRPSYHMICREGGMLRCDWLDFLPVRANSVPRSRNRARTIGAGSGGSGCPDPVDPPGYSRRVHNGFERS